MSVTVDNTTAGLTSKTVVIEETGGEPTFESFLDFDEIAAPGSPSANVGRLYVADAGGTTTLYFKDSGGTATSLLSGGVSALNDLSDVTITAAAQGEILVHNGTAFVDFAVGTDGMYLRTKGAGANPEWGNIVAGDINGLSPVPTGAWDFGGATSLEIPNGAAPTVDAAGEIALDTTITDYTGMMKYHDGVEELTVLAVPTANLSTTDGYVVAYNAGNNELEFVEMSASGGGTKTYAKFTALDNQPPAANYATFDTRNSIACLDFDDTTEEVAVFVSVMPEAASLGSGLLVRIKWTATSATSGDCRWGVAFETEGTDYDADSFDTATEATTTTNGTSGILTTTEITATNIDSVTAGKAYRLKVYRDVSDAADTMSGDAELIAVEVRSAA